MERIDWIGVDWCMCSVTPSDYEWRPVATGGTRDTRIFDGGCC